MANISISMKPERMMQIFSRLENEKDQNAKTNLSDVVNALIQKGFAYEALIELQTQEKLIVKKAKEETKW